MTGHFPDPERRDFRMTSEPLLPLLEQLQGVHALSFWNRQRNSNLQREFLRGNSLLLKLCIQTIYINVVLCPL